MDPDTLYSHSRHLTVLPLGRTSSHVHIKPSSGKPNILFLHGFPGTSYIWRHQILLFSQREYGIVAPDLLGYREIDKPMELESYNLKTMSLEVMSLLDCLSIERVLGVAHDW